MLKPLQKTILNAFQQDFPLSVQPYRDIANQIGVSEQEVINSLAELSELCYISRIGPVIRPNRIGVSTLAAMQVSPNELKQTIALINAFPEVNHNYEREHQFNIWFVVVASNKNRLKQVIQEIELQTGNEVMQLPLIEDYFIDLGFPLLLD